MLQKAGARTLAPSTTARLKAEKNRDSGEQFSSLLPLRTELINKWNRSPRALEPAWFHTNKFFRLTTPRGLG